MATYTNQKLGAYDGAQWDMSTAPNRWWRLTNSYDWPLKVSKFQAKLSYGMDAIYQYSGNLVAGWNDAAHTETLYGAEFVKDGSWDASKTISTKVSKNVTGQPGGGTSNMGSFMPNAYDNVSYTTWTLTTPPVIAYGGTGVLATIGQYTGSYHICATSSDVSWACLSLWDYYTVEWSVTGGSAISKQYDGNPSNQKFKFDFTTGNDSNDSMTLMYKLQGTSTWVTLQEGATSGTYYNLPSVTDVGSYTWDVKAVMYNKEVSTTVSITITAVPATVTVTNYKGEWDGSAHSVSATSSASCTVYYKDNTTDSIALVEYLEGDGTDGSGVSISDYYTSAVAVFADINVDTTSSLNMIACNCKDNTSDNTGDMFMTFTTTGGNFQSRSSAANTWGTGNDHWATWSGKATAGTRTSCVSLIGDSTSTNQVQQPEPSSTVTNSYVSWLVGYSYFYPTATGTQNNQPLTFMMCADGTLAMDGKLYPYSGSHGNYAKGGLPNAICIRGFWNQSNSKGYTALVLHPAVNMDTGKAGLWAVGLDSSWNEISGSAKFYPASGNVIAGPVIGPARTSTNENNWKSKTVNGTSTLSEVTRTAIGQTQVHWIAVDSTGAVVGSTDSSSSTPTAKINIMPVGITITTTDVSSSYTGSAIYSKGQLSVGNANTIIEYQAASGSYIYANAIYKYDGTDYITYGGGDTRGNPAIRVSDLAIGLYNGSTFTQLDEYLPTELYSPGGNISAPSSSSTYNIAPQTAIGSTKYIAMGVDGRNVSVCQPVFVTTTVTKIKVDPPTVSGQNIFTYTGSAISFTSQVTYDSAKSTWASVTSGTNAGSYTPTFTLKDTTNYIWSDTLGTETRTLPFYIGPKLLDVPTLSATSFVYSGSSQGPTISGYDSSTMTQSGTTSATSVGSYTIKYDLKNTTNYNWNTSPVSTSTQTLSWAITTKYLGTKPSNSTVSVTYDTASHSSGHTPASSWVEYKSGNTSGTNVGSYVAYYGPKTGCAWGSSGSDTSTYSVTLIINVRSISAPSGTPVSFTYDGGTHVPTWSYDSTYVTIGGDSGSKTAAGSYAATFTLNKNGTVTNTKWADSTTAAKSISWVINKKSLTIPSTSSSFVYNGSAQSAVISNYNSTLETQSGTTSATTVGTYTVSWALKDSSNYQWSDGSTAAKSSTWKITQKPVTIPTLNKTSWTYSGSAQGPATSNFTSYDSSLMSLSGNSGTNAGSYTAKIALSDKKNYIWSGSTTDDRTYAWTITKAASTITAPGNQVVALNSPTKTVSCTFDGDGTLSVSSSDTSIVTATISGKNITVTGKAVGSATITISGTAGTNYAAPTSKTFTVKVSNAAFNLTVTPVNVVYDGSTHYLEASSDIDGVSVVCDGLTTSLAVAGTSYKISNSYTNVQNVSYTIQATKASYETIDTSESIIIRKKGVGGKPDATVSKTYTGSEQTNGYTTPSNVTMTGDNKGTNAGDYTATYTPGSNYCWGTDEATYGAGDSAAASCKLTIGKASLTIPSGTPTSFTYTGSAQGPTISGVTSGKVTQSGTATATNVSTYTITWSLDDSSNYQWSDGTVADKSLSWKITPALINKPVYDSTSFVYNKAAQGPSASNFSPYDSTKMSLSGNSGTNVGTYTAVVSLNDKTNYNWSDNTTTDQSYSWSITKATNPMIANNQSVSATESPTAQTIAVSPATGAEGTVTYVLKSGDAGFSLGSSSSPNLTMVGGKATGSYSVVLTATAAGNANYNSISKDFTVSISVGVSEKWTVTIVTNTNAISGVEYKREGGTSTTYTAAFKVKDNEKIQITGLTYVTSITDYSIQCGTDHITLNTDYTVSSDITINCNVKLTSGNFYGTDALDDANIVAGKEIFPAATFSSIITKLTEIAPIFGLTCSIAAPSSNTAITAAKYNEVARFIDSLVATQSYSITTQTQTASTSKIEATNANTDADSLKKAMNTFISTWNASI